MRKALFIDRDGTLVVEPPDDFQVDTLEKLEFLPGVFRNLYLIDKNFDYDLIMVSNQDGLGGPAYPESAFNLVQDKILTALGNEEIRFRKIHIDRSLPEEQLPTRKPGTGMLAEYTDGSYDLASSYVIGDRMTDLELARNLGAKGILLGSAKTAEEVEKSDLSDHCALIAADWTEIYHHLLRTARTATVIRETSETRIQITLSLDGGGKSRIGTGLGFFDHMLEQIARHGGMDLEVEAEGDLHVDEHHTVEDTALALGEAFNRALGDRRGLQRYGFVLPMDESRAQVTIDFGGRNWLEWEAAFKREKIGDMPAELFEHFFKSFTDTAKCNLHVQAVGRNEHHLAEAIFKAFARALRQAVKRTPWKTDIPSTKGSL